MAFLLRLKRTLRAALQTTSAPTTSVLDAMLQLELAREFSRLQSELLEKVPDNPAAHGFKVYSQSDEDGIIETICDRLNLKTGIFVEIGCGDGRENNTHYLLLKGWRGVWIDGDADNIHSIRSSLPEAKSDLRVVECCVTRENVAGLLRNELSLLAALPAIDLLSVDIDGNDLPVTIEAVQTVLPKLLVVEYNAKFPYPMSQCVKYDPAHVWRYNDYHGASLGAWIEALHGRYELVCCNIAGTNAFFARHDVAAGLALCEPAALYQPARFYLTALRSGHGATLSFLADRLSARRSQP